MTLKHRIKYPAGRKQDIHDPISFVIIATEGELTEKQYFSLFDDRNRRVIVEVIPSEGGKSSPEHVLERLNKYAEKFQIGEGDTLCLMLDFDRWGNKKLAEVTKTASQKKYLLAISNPCFECWLLLHFEYITEKKLDSSSVIKRLKNHPGGYNKSRLDVEKFRKKVSDAVRRAKALDKNSEERWPTGTGTHVYKVVEKIIKTDNPEIRR